MKKALHALLIIRKMKVLQRNIARLEILQKWVKGFKTRRYARL
jgi:hypothetical protein